MRSCIGRISINLALAALRMQGPTYDVPIALGLLIASEQVMPESVGNAVIVGELLLDGSLRHIRGVLPMAVLARRESLTPAHLAKAIQYRPRRWV
ncbi:MAG: magnesium chelatase domain-containing protein [Anaerolineales bacterium]